MQIRGSIAAAALMFGVLPAACGNDEPSLYSSGGGGLASAARSGYAGAPAGAFTVGGSRAAGAVAGLAGGNALASSGNGNASGVPSGFGGLGAMTNATSGSAGSDATSTNSVGGSASGGSNAIGGSAGSGGTGTFSGAAGSSRTVFDRAGSSGTTEMGTGGAAGSNNTLASGGTLGHGGVPQDNGGSFGAGSPNDSGGSSSTGSASTTAEAGAAGAPMATQTILIDPVEAGTLAADWTGPAGESNPMVTIAEVSSPYDGGTAIQTSGVGTSTTICETKTSWREYSLPSQMLSNQVALDLYLALDSDKTYHNWPGFEIVLFREGTYVGYVVYFRAASLGDYLLDQASNWHDIVYDGFHRLDLAPLFDANRVLAPEPIPFDSFRVFLINYACEGTNSVVFDAMSVVSVL